MENNVTSLCVFRGVEYIVTATVINEDQLVIEVEDRVTADQWRNTFDATYIEDLTHKTGNFKQFSIFVNMLNSALSKSSESVVLDLLTYADLESLRNRKSGIGSRNIPGAQKAALSSKRYLIVTYTVEFDRIHYPLPLPYQGKPDPVLLQNTIRELRDEVNHMKKQLQPEYRNAELHRLQKDYKLLLQEKQDIESSLLQFRREMKTTTKGSSVKEIRILKNAVKNSEEELMNERRKFQRSSAKRNQEFKNLVEEVEELRASERNLRVRVKSLVNELAVYKRSNSRARSSPSLPTPRVSHRKPARSSLSAQERASHIPRQRSISRERPNQTRRRSTSRGRAPSLSSIGSRSPAGGRVPRFNPTAYIEDKKRRDQDAKSKAERRKRYGLSGLSSQERGRARSRSQTNSGRVRLHSRASSADSRGSRRSSTGLSDIEPMSDVSQNRSRKRRGVLKTGRHSSYWDSPDVPYREKGSTGKGIRLMSTPDPGLDRHGLRKPHRSTQKLYSAKDDYYDRGAEMSDIDARLIALQEFMKTNMD